jgi:hypothetical protein
VRKLVIAPLIALALSIPAAAPALAAGHPGSSSSSGSTDHQGEGSGHGKAKQHWFVDSGTLTAADASASTVTFTLQRGTNKKLRGTDVTVSVSADTVIRRDRAAATLTDLAAGDRIAVQGYRTSTTFVATLILDRSATGTEIPSPTATSAPTPTTTTAPQAA